MSGHSGEGYEPNLTPILDMVFQLITFFMLVINFKGAALDLSLRLPVLGSARPLEYIGHNEPITLNIAEDGTVKSYGELIDPEKFIAQEARLQKLQQEGVSGKKASDELTTPIIIRADHSIPFSTINEIIRTCQKNGFRSFALSAMSKQEGR
ncbi:Biopolymer transport protein ExbD/TolR [Planctopirus limnophila DSM 3776]|uniref:Biopolymer transport protein ExbD/TolR n=2 Tax=Planctopirus TaxID=1649480 RepID=D5SWI0_PLAL2|nr:MULTISPECIES: biopolymer transporter ExbD [Planctopirus]ADG69573.1 Biopolymer transport protein ExbD/TolR [Planctopirus limnophila DSM 3776]QDV28540.1 Biopolymer transport protein ExbD/TolR [Planctopirus ephydatiae]